MHQNRPRISIFTTCKNGGEYLRDSLDSIFKQTFQDFEVVLVDGVSTDNTIEILKEYEKDSRLRWISEKDSDANEGFYKALMMCRGKYVMCLPISDVYLSKTWFQKCVNILDNDTEVSLVFGATSNLDEDGTLRDVTFPDWFKKPLPVKRDFLPFWLATFCFITELTYCVRKNVYLECFPSYRQKPSFYKTNKLLTNAEFDVHGPFLKFIYNFNIKGYLSYFLPLQATGGRNHQASRNNSFGDYLKYESQKFTGDIVEFREKLAKGDINFSFKDGNSNIIQTLTKKDIVVMSRKIIKYRIYGNIMFNYKDKLNIKNYFAPLKRVLMRIKEYIF